MNRLKRQKRDMPVEMITREEFNEYISILEDVDSLLGSMGYNPDATRINNLHNRIKRHLKEFKPL